MDIDEIVTWRMLDELQINDILKQDIVLIRGINSDDRDKYIINRLDKEAIIFELEYKPEEMNLIIKFGKDNSNVLDNPDPVDNAVQLAMKIQELHKLVLIDITGLSTEALFLVLSSFKEIGYDNLIASYVQPLSYRSERNEILMPNYLLSAECTPISAIPGFVRLSNDLQGLVIVFLGFEGGRFKELREYLMTDGPTEISPVLPLPSYSAGWHMLGLYCNLETLKEFERIHELKRITAWDPFYALNMLEKSYTQFSTSNQIIVAPMGTKPHTLASALFALRHDDVRIMYDHPRTLQHRSIGVGEVRGYILNGLMF